MRVWLEDMSLAPCSPRGAGQSRFFGGDSGGRSSVALKFGLQLLGKPLQVPLIPFDRSHGSKVLNDCQAQCLSQTSPTLPFGIAGPLTSLSSWRTGKWLLEHLGQRIGWWEERPLLYRPDHSVVSIQHAKTKGTEDKAGPPPLRSQRPARPASLSC